MIPYMYRFCEGLSIPLCNIWYMALEAQSLQTARSEAPKNHIEPCKASTVFHRRRSEENEDENCGFHPEFSPYLSVRGREF